MRLISLKMGTRLIGVLLLLLLSFGQYVQSQSYLDPELNSKDLHAIDSIPIKSDSVIRIKVNNSTVVSVIQGKSLLFPERVVLRVGERDSIDLARKLIYESSFAHRSDQRMFVVGAVGGQALTMILIDDRGIDTVKLEVSPQRVRRYRYIDAMPIADDAYLLISQSDQGYLLGMKEFVYVNVDTLRLRGEKGSFYTSIQIDALPPRPGFMYRRTLLNCRGTSGYGAICNDYLRDVEVWNGQVWNVRKQDVHRDSDPNKELISVVITEKCSSISSEGHPFNTCGVIEPPILFSEPRHLWKEIVPIADSIVAVGRIKYMKGRNKLYDYTILDQHCQKKVHKQIVGQFSEDFGKFLTRLLSICMPE